MSYEGKHVLVTGADGFMGSHLTEALLYLGADVSVLVRGSSVSGTSRYTFKNLGNKVRASLKEIICCDIASPDSTELVVNLAPDVIMHLAAIAYVPFSFEHPREVLDANLIGTINMLEAARRLPDLERIVCTSSSEVYGSALTASISEKHPLNPTSPYAASKAAADRYCYSYHFTYGLPIAVIRPFNTYGPRHTYDVIPKFIDLALAGKDITIYGDGKQSRDFTYVADMVNAFVIMGMHSGAIGRVVNFGTGRDYTILETAQRIVEISGSKSKIVHTPARLAEVQRLTCDPTLAMELFFWKASIGFSEGLQENIEWRASRG